MKTMAVATGNKHKLQEFGEILAPLGWRVASIREWLPDVPEPDETEPDFAGNAALKCRFAVTVLRAVGLESLPDAVCADDSGLAVNALGGAPGVYSARFAERAGHGAGDADNRVELVRRLALAGLEPDQTTPAAFACAIHYQNLSLDTHHSVLAWCEGRVGLVERGNSGFGYDPLFFPYLSAGRLSDKTFAELPAATKHALSHRGKALRILAARL
jgi:XTP/dITP diphosphohydrolase